MCRGEALPRSSYNSNRLTNGQFDFSTNSNRAMPRPLPTAAAMKYDLDKHHRRSIRLKGYDYTQVGAYFAIICARNRECLFGEIVDGEMQLNEYGKIVAEEWLNTTRVRANVELDEFVVMPNHFHGILVIVYGAGAGIVGANRVGAQRRCAPTETHPNVVPGSVEAIVRSLKSVVTKRVNEMRNTPGVPVGQRNYGACPERSEGNTSSATRTN